MKHATRIAFITVHEYEQVVYGAAQLVERWLSRGISTTPLVAGALLAYLIFVFRQSGACRRFT